MEDIGKWIIDRHVPIYSTIETTWRCNLKCIHCDMDPPRKDEKELSTEEIKDFLRQAAKEGSLFLTLTGGEPMLRKDLWEILEYARSLQFITNIITNGTLMNETFADNILNLGIIKVDISIYGVTAPVHDAITGVPGSFEMTKNAIRLLRERDININLLSVLMRDNFFQYHELRQSAEDMGVEYNISPTIFPKRNGSLNPLKLRINDEQLKEYVDGRLPDGCRNVKELCKPDNAIPHCYFGRLYCVVDAYGSVYPCIVRTASVGNLRKESLRKIWRESSGLKSIRSITSEDLKECNICQYKSICDRCPALAYAEDGSYTQASSEACRTSKQVMEVFNESQEKVSTA